MDTDKFKCFLTLADTLNYTAAASVMHKSQSVLSRQISSLEENLGFELFIRDSKQVKLTNAGLHMRTGMQNLVAQYSELVSKAQQISDGVQGVLTIAFPAGEISTAYHEIFNEFKIAYPKVELNFVSYEVKDTINLLKNCSVDFLLTVNTNPWFSHINRHEFQHINIGVRSDLLYIPANHPLARKEESELTLLDFKDDTFMIFEEFEVDLPQGLCMKTCVQNGFVPKYKLCNSLPNLMVSMQNEYAVCIGSNRLFLSKLPYFRSYYLEGLLKHTEIIMWNTTNMNPCTTSFLGVLKNFLITHPEFRNNDFLLK